VRHDLVPYADAYPPFERSSFVLAVIKLGRIKRGILLSEESKALKAEFERLGIEITDKKALALALEGEDAKNTTWKAVHEDGDPTDFLPEWLKTHGFLELMKKRLAYMNAQEPAKILSGLRDRSLGKLWEA
jgi:hypothetical protein